MHGSRCIPLVKHGSILVPLDISSARYGMAITVISSRCLQCVSCAYVARATMVLLFFTAFSISTRCPGSFYSEHKTTIFVQASLRIALSSHPLMRGISAKSNLETPSFDCNRLPRACVKCMKSTYYIQRSQQHIECRRQVSGRSTSLVETALR